MSDIAAWLTQIWDEQEKAATNRWTSNPLAPPVEVHYGASIGADMVTVSAPGSSITHTMTPEEYQRAYLVPAPDKQALARIAADRQILRWCTERDRIYVGTVGDDPSDPKHYVRGGLTHPTDSVVLRLLASAYSDRPGYREEWKP